MKDVDIRIVQAVDAPWIVAQHAAHYATEEGFDATFGPLVAHILEDFFAGHDPERETGWIAERDGTPLGCIFCVRLSEETAKLRLFLTVAEARGTGLGARLLATCMKFARTKGYRDMTLWTHESHRAACALYARTGWQLVESHPVHSFGCDLVEQTWKITL